ncbi:hypothetical protein GCM10023184_14670 [Flaviaesturariibacter amylovorans]|uniref:Uncharacterized protein n=1 Tax=Flaviaesturariibacter amylovorans TaxID=1084520 RepID=A0ABP8GKP8_9BACT
MDQGGHTMQANQQEARKQIQQSYGWFFLGKQVADYTRCTYFEVMERPAIDVLSMVQIIKMENEMNRLNHG